MEIVGFFEAIIRSDLKQPLLEKHDQTSQRSHTQKSYYYFFFLYFLNQRYFIYNKKACGAKI